MKKWKKGDWGFWNFELAYIKEVKDENITRVGTGVIESYSSSFNDRFFPLDVITKQISDSVKYWSDSFHRDCRDLNYPDIHRKLTQMWCDAVEVKDDIEKLQKEMSKINEFGHNVIERYKNKNCEEVDGVNIFR